VNFLRRVFSGDYRRGQAAEAAGDLDRAAECYGLAGEREDAMRMHLLRAARAGSRTLEIAALRDALHWAGDDPVLRQRPAAALGGALLKNLQAEGIATERDRERVREAAELLAAGGEHQRAGEALDNIGDSLAAANVFSAGGLVEMMEEALAKDDDGQRRSREEQSAFANYQTNMSIGRRDEARIDLQQCIHSVEGSAEYRRLLATLETKLITGGRVELLVRSRQVLVVCAVKRVVLGRDALCDLALRSGGVSRQHAEIEVHSDPTRFTLHDLGSRNGTSVGGLPVAGHLPLLDTGRFSLGDECVVDFEVVQAEQIAPVLQLRVNSGLDRGSMLLAGTEQVAIDLTPAELGVAVSFRNGRPFLQSTTAREVRFAGAPLGAIAVQLIRGDQLRIDGVDVDVG
jgi:tetratricopeptide (TPR) repeat protein